MELDDIMKYWEKSGEQYPREGKITPTSRDPYLGELERENILDYLRPDQNVLEIGCGSGYHTIWYAKKAKKVLGIDIAQSLVDIAKQTAVKESIKNADFIVGSVLDLKKIVSEQEFDCVISKRCLINLPKWQLQQEAIRQIHRILVKDGLCLFSEGFQGELDNLNSVRRDCGLSEINVVSYNKNFNREEFEAFIESLFKVEDVRHYGFYLFISRIFHPCAVMPQQPQHDARLNEVAMEISRKVRMPDMEKHSYNKFYVLRRK